MPEEKGFQVALKRFESVVDEPHEKILDINRQIEKLVQQRGVLKEAALGELKLPEGAGNRLRAACW